MLMPVRYMNKGEKERQRELPHAVCLVACLLVYWLVCLLVRVHRTVKALWPRWGPPQGQRGSKPWVQSSGEWLRVVGFMFESYGLRAYRVFNSAGFTLSLDLEAGCLGRGIRP